jgi:RimJ/RimL family protein N-acetyltransferase
MLLGTRIKLVPLSREYIPFFLKWFNDPEVTQYLLMYLPMTKESEEEWYTEAIRSENKVIFVIIAIEDPLHEKPIGNVGIVVDWKNRVGNLGITIGDKGYWGKGYGTEALQLLIRYGFNTLNLHRLNLDVYAFNERAQKCYRKVGFREEGKRREAIYINGAYHDLLTLGLLVDEWKSSQIKK